MKRHIDSVLLEWKNSSSRKPLLLFGARQVGKTYSLKNFGKKHFKNFVHIDFSKKASARQIFENSLDPTKIISMIQALTHKKITPKDTLIIFDEIQLCEAALTSLKYFCENVPEYYVVAAGSLLGVKLRESGSFPVGKVDMRVLHPLNFDEFLIACGNNNLTSIIQECASTLEFCPLHDQALDSYREYLLVGGMPDVVKEFVSARSSNELDAYTQARAKQNEIGQAYLADIAKHAPSNLVPRILDVWRSCPSQLAKENSKFQYKAVRSGGRALMYEEPVGWLVAAGVVAKCNRVSDALAPLNTFEDASSFKLYRTDTGILANSYEALPGDVLPQNTKTSHFRGALAENYVMQQFMSADVRPHYWGIPSKCEVDFIARDKNGDVVPIEVKSGGRVRSNSLESYRKKYNPAYVARLSTKNFGKEKFVHSIPLYAACYFAQGFLSSPEFM